MGMWPGYVLSGYSSVGSQCLAFSLVADEAN